MALFGTHFVRALLALVIALVILAIAWFMLPIHGMRNDIIIDIASSTEDFHAEQIVGNSTIIAEGALRTVRTNDDRGTVSAFRVGQSGTIAVTAYHRDKETVKSIHENAYASVLLGEQDFYRKVSNVYIKSPFTSYEVIRWSYVVPLVLIATILATLLATMFLPRARRAPLVEEAPPEMKNPFADYLTKKTENTDIASVVVPGAGLPVMDKHEHDDEEVADEQDAPEYDYPEYIEDEENVEEELDEAPSPSPWLSGEDEDIVPTAPVASVHTSKSDAPGNLPVVDASVFGMQKEEYDAPDIFERSIPSDNVEEASEESMSLNPAAMLPVTAAGDAEMVDVAPDDEALDDTATVVDSATEDVIPIDPSVDPSDEELKKRLNQLLRGDIS